MPNQQSKTVNKIAFYLQIVSLLGALLLGGLAGFMIRDDSIHPAALQDNAGVNHLYRLTGDPVTGRVVQEFHVHRTNQNLVQVNIGPKTDNYVYVLVPPSTVVGDSLTIVPLYYVHEESGNNAPVIKPIWLMVTE